MSRLRCLASEEAEPSSHLRSHDRQPGDAESWLSRTGSHLRSHFMIINTGPATPATSVVPGACVATAGLARSLAWRDFSLDNRERPAEHCHPARYREPDCGEA